MRCSRQLCRLVRETEPESLIAQMVSCGPRSEMHIRSMAEPANIGLHRLELPCIPVIVWQPVSSVLAGVGFEPSQLLPPLRSVVANGWPCIAAAAGNDSGDFLTQSCGHGRFLTGHVVCFG